MSCWPTPSKVVAVNTEDTRRLPMYGAGELTFPVLAFGNDEFFERDTHWEAHSHPTHELLWNETGAGTAFIGRRTWTVTGRVALWIPAGMPHTGRTPAGIAAAGGAFLVGDPGPGAGGRWRWNCRRCCACCWCASSTRTSATHPTG
jgi:hypothetical protein